MQYTVAEIAKALGADMAGNGQVKITRPSEPATADADHLALAMEKAFLPDLAKGQAKAAVVPPDTDWQALGLEAAIFAPRSRYVMAGVNRVFERPIQISSGIHPSAVIEDGARIGENPAIGPFVHIGAGAEIGANARIASHCSIGAGTIIGDDVLLHPGVHIAQYVRIGDRFIAQSGAVIGGDGFSFVTPKPGAVEEARTEGRISEASRTAGFVRINSVGGVSIGDDVEVGANSTIDRGTVADTTIGNGTKLDNNVDVGHNAQLGSHCLLCGQSGVAGSAVVGDRVVLGGQSGVADHITIGSDVILTGQTGASSNVPSGRIMMGTPAIKMELAVASYQALRRLPRTLASLREITNQVSKRSSND